MPALFERGADGALWCNMHRADAEAIALLADRLADRLSDDAPVHDAAFNRLFPRAYLDPTEEEAAREWNSLVRPDLVRSKTSALSRLATSLRAAASVDSSGGMVSARLEAEDVEAWLGALNDLRLDVGTRLGVTEERDPSGVAPDDPDAPWWAVYDFLTWCQGMLLEAVLEGSGDP